MAQTLKNYNQDEAYRQAANRIGYGQTAPTYQGTYESQLNDLYDKIANRQPFSYDVNADPLYDMYKDKYIQGGKLAMKDTMGQAAALTGGYGNTYGQQVGQQAYDAYLQNLSDVIPQLYGMAYDQWKDQGDDLKDLYGMLGARRDTEYGMWRDAMSDYNTNRGLVQQQEAQDYARLLALDQLEYDRAMDDYKKRYQEEERDYNRRWNEENRDYTRRYNEENRDYTRAFNEDERDYNRGLTADNTQYTRQQQAFTNLLALIQASGYMPTDEELAAAGITREAADAMRNEYLRQIALKGGTVAGGGAAAPGSGGGASRAAAPGSGGGSVYIPPAGQGPGDGYVTIDQVADDAAANGDSPVTRSQVMNEVNKNRDKFENSFEPMDIVYSMVSSGHSGSTAEGRKAEEEYLKDKINTNRSAAAAGWGDTTKKLKELGIIK